MREFKEVFSSVEYSDKVFLFLQVVFNLRPEARFFNKIKEATAKFESDAEIYQEIQRTLNDKFIYNLQYSLPALFKQKKVIGEQMIDLLTKSEVKCVNKYLEVGTTGRYAGNIKRNYNPQKIILVHDTAPGFSPLDILDREQISKFQGFETIAETLPLKYEKSLDLISCIGGIHHFSPKSLEAFVASVSKSLKEGGLFIVREHDCQHDLMKKYVSVIHSIFNAGTCVTLEENEKEIRNFKSVYQWVDLLDKYDLKFTGNQLAQKNDPSNNLLLSFRKV